MQSSLRPPSAGGYVHAAQKVPISFLPFLLFHSPASCSFVLLFRRDLVVVFIVLIIALAP